MPRFVTCRYRAPGAASMCLAWTVDGECCAPHIGQAQRDQAAFLAKPLPVREPVPVLAESSETPEAQAARRARWPFWPGAEAVGFPVHSCDPDKPCPVLVGSCAGPDPDKWPRPAFLPREVEA